MKFKYAFVWGDRTAFFYADDMKTAKEDFTDTFGIDADDPKWKVTVSRTNA